MEQRASAQRAGSKVVLCSEAPGIASLPPVTQNNSAEKKPSCLASHTPPAGYGASCWALGAPKVGIEGAAAGPQPPPQAPAWPPW
eukprot:scaffold62156_cov27-Tisochrysis_lutea.AAC.2